ncbi:MAG TPA: DNA adenine methylase [Candidatus Xenobia bacterium]|nr:DNA adenine methylase [Candidatus Xenobia bacterium]
MNNRIINVASVPQLSPFRYPGGKTWLVPYLRQWLKNHEPISEFIEPFAGGAIVGLTVAFENLANHVTLIERDPEVAAVWQTILNGKADWLAKRILSFEPTGSSIRKLFARNPRTIRDRAFATIVRNRVQRGGILAPGAGLMKKGENKKGLKSRWYPETLASRIRAIAEHKSRIRVERADGMHYIEKTARRKDVAYFIDPPYVTAGKRLYRYSDVDHERLFRIMTKASGDFLMTYEDTMEIRGLAIRYGFDLESIPMKNTHNQEKRELLIGRDVEWLRTSDESSLVFPESLPQTLPA